MHYPTITRPSLAKESFGVEIPCPHITGFGGLLLVCVPKGCICGSIVTDPLESLQARPPELIAIAVI